MPNLMLSAYLGCAFMASVQAAELEGRLECPIKPNALSPGNVTPQPGGLSSGCPAVRLEPSATLVPLTAFAGASAALQPSDQRMFSKDPKDDYKEVGITSTPALEAQYEKTDSSDKRWFIGSTFLMLGNFIPNDRNPPDFTQLNIGYRITPDNVVFIELKRSKFSAPLGIPWGPSFDAPGENYPGYVRQNVIGLAYNHFWWKNLYTGIHAMNAFQKYYNDDNKIIASGYTLFITYRLGYQLNFFNNRFFFEPSIGFTHWPIKTNTPESFKIKENKWPKYFAFEPGLHFGVNF